MKRSIRDPIKSYENHFAILGERATHCGAVKSAAAYADRDFDKIRRKGERLIVTALYGRGVRLEMNR